jgi:anti-sigma regulatory factor (Ser/Thr protein kinase)
MVGDALAAHLHRSTSCGLPGQAAFEELGDALSLMTSELVTNAVTHAPTCERVIEVTLWRADGMLWLAVSDCGEVFPVRNPRPPDPVAPVYPDPESDHGRGLYLVEALADVWTVIARPTVGKSVVAGLRLR